jgi:putative ABC transport system substrate-binding protein
VNLFWILDCRFWIEESRAKKIFCFALTALLFALSVKVEAQQPRTVYRIGYLSNSVGNRQQEEGFSKGLRELGYIDGQNMIVEWRFTKGRSELLPRLAAELVELNVQCLVTNGILATRAAKEATNTIPIVMGNASDDPVRHGLIVSLACPGGNITGVIDIASDLAGKRLEVLNETFPRISRVGHVSDRGSPTGTTHLKETEAAARGMGLRFLALELQGAGEFENAFQAASKERADALVIAQHGFVNSYRERVVSLANKTRLPALYGSADFVRAGGLMSYADDPIERARRAAVFVTRFSRVQNPRTCLSSNRRNSSW